MYVDSHCHLNFPELRSELPAIREAMQQARVHAALCICTTMEEFDEVHALTQGPDRFWASVGVHPDNEGVHEPTEDELITQARRPRVVALGETGLDYFRLEGRSVADMAWQRERFAVHIRAARRSGLPLIVHTRAASEDTLALLRTEGQGEVRGVFHCFTESMAVARAALDLGFHLSFSGILTFKSARELQEVARFVPLDRCLIETDSPYLAPVPFRGKTNTPALVPWVARQLAALRGIPEDAVAEATTRNFEALFGVSTGSSR